MNYLEDKLYLEDVARVSTDKKINFDEFKNKSFLVTGASGLICSFLIDVLMYRNKYFNDNIKIYMICRNEEKLMNRFSYYNLEKYSKNNNSNLIYIIQDINNKIDFKMKFDYIIHGASNTHPKLYSMDPVGTITTNVIGLNNILDYCKNYAPKKIFVMSSVEVYGENKGDTLLFCEDYLGYINCNTVRAGYPESKRLCESLAQAYISQYNLDIVIGRLSRVYGPTMLKDDSKALAQFIKNAVNNEDIILKSEGKQYFSYTYMADVVGAILFLLNFGKNGEAYNIADLNSNIRLKDLANILANYNNRKVVFELPSEMEKKGYSTATKAVMDSKKINDLGWRAYYSIDEGLIRTIKIMQNLFKEKN